MSGRLSGKTAVITGASSGIGRAIALHLADEGADCVITGRSAGRLGEVKVEIENKGRRAIAVAGDIRDFAFVKRLVDTAVSETGRINIMVNAAGLESGFGRGIAEGDPEQWREMLETNVLALLMGAKAAINAMRKNSFEGHIVNIGSDAGRREASGVYGATKAAVNSIGMTLRQELEKDNIRVTQILPGAVLTNFGRNFPPEFINAVVKSLGFEREFKRGDTFAPELIEKMQSRATKMFASANDIAQAVVYAVTQPIHLNVYEIEVRPAQGFSLSALAGRPPLLP